MNSVRVFYDGAIFSIQTQGGVNRYFCSLIEGLGSRIDALVSYTKPQTSRLPIGTAISTCGFPRFGFRPGRLSYWMEGCFFKARRAMFAPEILHPTYYTLLTQEISIPRGIPVVATIFDLVHERFPDTTDPDGTLRGAKRRLLDRADALIVLSQHTKGDIVDYYGIPASRIQVIPPAFVLPTPPVTPIQDRRSPRVLFLGNRWTYKNFPSYLRAVAIASQRFPDLKGIVVGPPFSDQENAIIRDLHVADLLVHLGYASDQALDDLYRSVDALIYPSSYEGFGFPIVEAFLRGTPVITTSAASIPEVAGEGALFADPKDHDQIAGHIVQILESPSLVDHLRSAGAQQSLRFTGSDGTQAVHAVYTQLIS